jgi:hypothetical protein
MHANSMTISILSATPVRMKARIFELVPIQK